MTWVNLREDILDELLPLGRVEMETNARALEWGEWNQARVNEAQREWYWANRPRALARLRQNHQRNKESRVAGAKALKRRIDQELRRRRRALAAQRQAALDALARQLGATPLPMERAS